MMIDEMQSNVLLNKRSGFFLVFYILLIW